MKVCAVTDEISQDPETAIELATDWGIRHVELRELWGKRVPDIDRTQKETLIEILNRYGVNVLAISPGIFKVPASRRDLMEEHLHLRLLKSFELAESLGTNIVIIFSPIRESQQEQDIFRDSISFFRSAADRAEERNMTLALENEASCLADTGSSVARLVKAVASNKLFVNWDPCNSFLAGQDPFPTGYLEVRDMIRHVHLKDCLSDGQKRIKRYVPIGQGEAKTEELLRELSESHYQGGVSVETHFRPKVKGTRDCIGGLRTILQRIGEIED